MKYDRTHRILQFIIGLGFIGLLSAGIALGQATSSITGVVSDPSGAVVPGATVTVTNQATGVTFTQPTNSSGVYYFRSLIPGTYTVKVVAQGFEAYLSNNNILSADRVFGLNVTLKVGAETQTVTVESAAPMVNTEEGHLSTLVSGSEVANLALNGRDIYQLMKLVPGAVNSGQVDFEGGDSVNINGTRANFNGFLLDGVPNKDLSGGSLAQPAPDFVQEFRIMTNDFSAEYGSSAGSMTDVSIKSGTNQFHGDLWEFMRNDALNSRNFFSGATVSPWKQNQFGGTIGGPIKKDKLFFFAGYEGERFRTSVPSQFTFESPQFRSAVESLFPNSPAGVLYKNFPGLSPTSQLQTVSQAANATIVNDIGAPIGSPYAGTAMLSDPVMGYTDPCFLNQFLGVGTPAFSGGPAWGNAQTMANTMAAIVGVSNGENAQIQKNIAGTPGCAGMTAPGVQAGALGPNGIMQGLVNGQNATRTQGVFYNGDQFTGRMDYQGDRNRLFGRFYYFMQKDPNSSPTTGIRGFTTPFSASFPGAAFGFVHNFSGNTVNEFHAGYVRSQATTQVSLPQYGVPDIGFDSGNAQFGAYNGYPQYFIEDIFDFRDMVATIKGNHSLKIGFEGRRNYENSQFDVGRPSYYFFDPMFFAAGLPYIEAAGVNPELGTSTPSHLDTNIRAFRNTDVAAFLQDDWKAKKNLTLNLGVRWDYFSPSTEKYGKATQFSNYFNMAQVNCQTFLSGKCLAPAGDTNTPNGGFTSAASLFKDRLTNFEPRIGFAWDPTGKGKMSIRGGFSLQYEESFYNALSNSRWNLPYYSFNEACPICGLAGMPTFGPTLANGLPATGIAATFSGSPTQPGAIGNGPGGLGFAGNIMGWYPGNSNLAALTGIPNPNYTLPYYENAFFGIQRELNPSTVLEVDYVGTWGRHLFWAEDPNRVVGGMQATAITPITNPCTGALVGGGLTAPTGLLNPCFGVMRSWDTSVNSNYNALQIQVNRRAAHGLTFNSNYTYSHSLDYRSTWHALSGSGSATDSNSAGEAGYSYDPNKVFLEYGNSLFDSPHKWVSEVMWDLPWMKAQHGFVGRVAGGWSANSIITLQSGFPFTVAAHRDFNGDGIRGDRPNAPAFGNSMSFSPYAFEAGSGPNGMSLMQTIGPAFAGATCTGASGCLGAFPIPTPGTDGNLGRNTFRGPGIAETDFSLFKQIPINERFNMQFRAEFFNLLNRTNLNPPNALLTSASFGLASEALDPREIQFGLKLFF
ncbi:MAG TPA: TonB-dependent receptor [Terriglobia bacterium]|nr:TonB-dependent receptor [Terriglobia bacterium]